MNKKREGNYDLLRILCALGVITIHVSSSYTNAVTDLGWFGQLYLDHIVVSCLYNVLMRFSVPCFVMLSGAFVLADERNTNYKYFYEKSFRSLGIPTLVFSCAYFLYGEAVAAAHVIIGGDSVRRLLYPFRSVLFGAPFYHMWYLYMLIGLYIITPLIIRFRQSVKESTFSKIVWIFFVLACISGWTSTQTVNWDVGKQACYLGFFLAGYELRKWGMKNKSQLKGYCLITAGVVAELLVVFLRYQQALAQIADNDLKYKLVAPFNPLIVAASVLIFSGFSLLKINTNFGKTASCTFLIYLFHAGVWEIGMFIVKRLVGYDGDNRIVIPVCIVSVFFLSWLLALIYQKLWKYFDKKWGISDKLCRLIFNKLKSSTTESAP